MANQNFKVKNGLEVGTGVTISAGIITATKFFGDGSGLSNASQWVSTNSGIHTISNVGIGTTNSQAKLQLNGTALITGAPTNDFTLANTAVIKKPSLVISSGVAYTHTGSYENISPLQIEATYSPSNIGSGYFYSQRFDTDLSPTESTGNSQYGLYNAVFRNNASDDYVFDTVYGVSNYYQQGDNLGSSVYTNKVYGLFNTLDNRKGDINQYYGVYNFIQHGYSGSSSTNTQNSYGIFNDVNIGSNDTVTNLYGAYFSAFLSTGATVTNHYGVYLDTVSNANIINNWSIYSSNNASKMYHQGSIGIGTINPTSKLSIIGDVSISGVTTSSSFVKSGGTSSQFLKADGSVDSNTYLTSYTETDTLNTVTSRGNITSNGISVGVLTATSLVKSGGTSSQFLKADGSVDSNTYLTSYTETDTLNTVTTRGNSTSNGISVGVVTATSVRDSSGNVRAVPQNSQTSAYILAASDVGKHISITTGGVTVNSGIFSAGDAVSIYNNSGSNQTITQGGSVTMYLVGTATTGNRTLAQRGVATILCVASNTFVIMGGGLT